MATIYRIAALLVALSLTACGGGDPGDNADTGPVKEIPTVPDCKASPQLCL